MSRRLAIGFLAKLLLEGDFADAKMYDPQEAAG
jgi:hypothetical protein